MYEPPDRFKPNRKPLRRISARSKRTKLQTSSAISIGRRNPIESNATVGNKTSRKATPGNIDTNIISPDQLQFLQAQSIPLSRVFDASGMLRTTYQAAMRELEMFVAVGVTPCKTSGHTIRTSAGHCAQCNTAALAFLRRHHESGDVYVAVSAQIGLVKIGTAQSAQARITTLNGFGYGGATDWTIHFQEFCDNAGRVEFIAQNTLAKYRTYRTYIKTGNTVSCQELFDCHASAATTAVKSALKKVAE